MVGFLFGSLFHGHLATVPRRLLQPDKELESRPDKELESSPSEGFNAAEPPPALNSKLGSVQCIPSSAVRAFDFRHLD
ncbi:unnamed protein product [Lota lota]